MKKIIVIVALFMLIKPIIPVLEYIAFYDYIKSELCENKDNKAMHCNGKCFLAKQLAKASDTENDAKDKKQLTIVSALVFCQQLPHSLEHMSYTVTEKGSISTDYRQLYTFKKESSLLRPPIAFI